MDHTADVMKRGERGQGISFWELECISEISHFSERL